MSDMLSYIILFFKIVLLLVPHLYFFKRFRLKC